MISFRFAQHLLVSGDDVVEILCDGEVCAVLYPGRADPKSVRMVSAHMTQVVHNDGRDELPPLPEVRVHFKVEPYTIQHGTIIRGRR